MVLEAGPGRRRGALLAGAVAATLLLAGCMMYPTTPTRSECRGGDTAVLVLYPDVSDEALAETFSKHGWTVDRAGPAFQARKEWRPETSSGGSYVEAFIHRMEGRDAAGEVQDAILIDFASQEVRIPQDHLPRTEIEEVEAGLLQELRSLGGGERRDLASYPAFPPHATPYWDCIHGD